MKVSCPFFDFSLNLNFDNFEKPGFFSQSKQKRATPPSVRGSWTHSAWRALIGANNYGGGQAI